MAPTTPLIKAEAVSKVTNVFKELCVQGTEACNNEDKLKSFLDAPAETVAPKLVFAIADLLKAHGFTTYKELDDAFKKGVHDEETSEAIEDYWDVLEEWHQVLALVDKKAALNQSNIGKGVGAAMPEASGLINVRDGTITTLEEIVNSLKSQDGVKKVHLLLLRHLA